MGGKPCECPSYSLEVLFRQRDRQGITAETDILTEQMRERLEPRRWCSWGREEGC